MNDCVAQSYAFGFEASLGIRTRGTQCVVETLKYVEVFPCIGISLLTNP